VENKFLKNISKNVPHYTALHPRRQSECVTLLKLIVEKAVLTQRQVKKELTKYVEGKDY
jgi:uncharacterized membrane protein YheB (UPF0754 family)